LTASLGISSFPEDGTTPIALINAADIALYQAKSQGRNRIVLYSADLAPNQSSTLHPHVLLAQQSTP
jgi:predicted signal transduction protein with EAL and GGDEF domain